MLGLFTVQLKHLDGPVRFLRVDSEQDVDAKESTKPALSRLDWRKYGQKSIS
jgi:hypothetical protein